MHDRNANVKTNVFDIFLTYAQVGKYVDSKSS